VVFVLHHSTKLHSYTLWQSPAKPRQEVARVSRFSEMSLSQQRMAYSQRHRCSMANTRMASSRIKYTTWQGILQCCIIDYGSVLIYCLECHCYILSLWIPVAWWCSGRVLNLRSNGLGFDSRLGHYQVVTTWTGDCLRTGKPSWYITNTKVNSAFHPFGVGKLSTILSGWS